MRTFINIVEGSYGFSEDKYWIDYNGSVHDVDNHDMWAEDFYADESAEDGVMYDREKAFEQGFIRMNHVTSSRDLSGDSDELNFEFHPEAVTHAAIRTAINHVKGESGKIIVNDDEFTDDRRAAAFLRQFGNKPFWETSEKQG